VRDLRSDPVLGLIGETPLVELIRFGSDAPRATLLAKLESRNPGGSVKDRPSLGMIVAARESGSLRPGQTIVEPTAGNTGIGLALVGARLGHPVVVVMPQRYSDEKRRLCEALGARVVGLPGDDCGMADCREEAERIAAAEDGVVLDQFSNPANPAIHETTTAPELWRQCEGRLDAIVVGVGTGGTFTGLARHLRPLRPGLLCVAVEGTASTLSGAPYAPSRIEGIGNRFEPATLDRSLVDEWMRVEDEPAFETARLLAASEGLLVGSSTGAVMHAALQVARRLGPGKRVATLVADGGERYCSQGLYDPTGA
jgi:cysteine synthase